MDELTGSQRKYLRGLAHGLKPVVHVGKQGLSDALVASVDEALESHELIKVRFVDFKEGKDELARELEQRLHCAAVGRIGHVVILFRPARAPENRRIRLPRGQ